MQWSVFATVFSTVFLAELGDKTQLATMLFAARNEVSRWQVFIAAASALVVSTAIGVAAGQLVSNHVSERTLHWIAGCGFITIGAWTLWKA
ncbi:MAG: TMEM165/GDT1 family protein [Planctomycetes bacterium]|nr:TMEM165/GDT1 family protein [Planctomycetota bacterium]